MALIIAAAAEENIEVRVLEEKQTSKSGYVCTQLKLRVCMDESGTILSPKTELQIRSTLMDRCSELEHITYDIWQGKNITKNNPELEKLLAPVIESVNKLSRNNLVKDYENYVISCYRYARSYELGEIEGEFELPDLPEILKDYDILSWKNLEEINKEIHRIKDGNTSEEENTFL